VQVPVRPGPEMVSEILAAFVQLAPPDDEA
jgi:hypothetical protein